MNLGIIYIEAFFAIVAASFFIALGVASILRLRSVSWHLIILVLLPLWLIIGFVLLDVGLNRLYSNWHRWQNSVVPQHGCISYVPQFNQLLATYEMNSTEFRRWVTDHPWELTKLDSPIHYDCQQFGLIDPEYAFANAPQPNGAQLRVYYKSGTAYIAYFAN